MHSTTSARPSSFTFCRSRWMQASSTPNRALILQAVWACLLLTPGNFESLVSLFGVASWLFYGSTGLGLMILRYTDPDHPRPYSVHGYPLTPVLLVLISSYLVISSVATAVVPSLLALAGSLLPIPTYFILRRLGWIKERQRGEPQQFIHLNVDAEAAATSEEHVEIEESTLKASS